MRESIYPKKRRKNPCGGGGAPTADNSRIVIFSHFAFILPEPPRPFSKPHHLPLYKILSLPQPPRSSGTSGTKSFVRYQGENPPPGKNFFFFQCGWGRRVCRARGWGSKCLNVFFFGAQRSESPFWAKEGAGPWNGKRGNFFFPGLMLESMYPPPRPKHVSEAAGSDMPLLEFA